MADLSTCYLGLELKNPLVVAASGLTSSVEGVRKAAAAGAGAVVLKSLFEEQLRAELAGAEASYEGAHPDAQDYFRKAGMTEGTAEYVELVKGAKKEGIPVIASLNCVAAGRWAEFASRIEEAGADALELNLGLMPTSLEESGAAVEKRLYAAVEEVGKATRLPLAVKLGPNWSSIANVAVELGKRGAQGLVLFNRFYRLDIDLAGMSLKPGPARSTGEEYHESLRWIAVLNDRVPCDLSASSGVHDAMTALRLVAAGARSVQLCSVIYRKGFGVIGEMNRAMEEWLDQNGKRSLGDIRGKLAQWKAADPLSYLRLQYIQALTGIS
jgi:dihydroorotate dehydrogenase (fumarate)